MILDFKLFIVIVYIDLEFDFYIIVQKDILCISFVIGLNCHSVVIEKEYRNISK